MSYNFSTMISPMIRVSEQVQSNHDAHQSYCAERLKIERGLLVLEKNIILKGGILIFTVSQPFTQKSKEIQ